MSKYLFPMLGLAAAAVLSAGIAAQDKPVADKHADHKMHAGHEACAKACNDCQRACDACASHCAVMLAEGKKDHLANVMECRDCATCCTAAAQIVSRGGPHSALICDCCAKACDQCAKACEKFPDDAMMKACAAECRKCEAACKAMMKHVGK